MRHLDLFSGIGGFAYAAQQVWGKDHEIIAFCEIDKFCQKVLKKHWPDVEIVEDIKDYDAKRLKGTVDILTGGFPCQPVSRCQTKNRKGSRDVRFLWPEMFRIIGEARPTWVLAENVSGIIDAEGGGICKQIYSDLEGAMYKTLPPLLLPACSVGVPHRRDRFWFLAYSGEQRCFENYKRNRQRENFEALSQTSFEGQQLFPDAYRIGVSELRKTSELEFCGKNDGVSGELDRLKSLGNAIVPQVAMVIMQAIKEIETKSA